MMNFSLMRQLLQSDDGRNSLLALLDAKEQEASEQQTGGSGGGSGGGSSAKTVDGEGNVVEVPIGPKGASTKQATSTTQKASAGASPEASDSRVAADLALDSLNLLSDEELTSASVYLTVMGRLKAMGVDVNPASLRKYLAQQEQKRRNNIVNDRARASNESVKAGGERDKLFDRQPTINPSPNAIPDIEGANKKAAAYRTQQNKEKYGEEIVEIDARGKALDAASAFLLEGDLDSAEALIKSIKKSSGANPTAGTSTGDSVTPEGSGAGESREEIRARLGMPPEDPQDAAMPRYMKDAPPTPKADTVIDQAFGPQAMLDGLSQVETLREILAPLGVNVNVEIPGVTV